MIKEKKYDAVHYHQYLQLDHIVNAQQSRSKAVGAEAHDEMLFIITHQAYELWFKQIIHELESVIDMFNQDIVDEKNIGIAVSRLQRSNEILKLLVNQIAILETMTPLDFLEFRNYLIPASGFQSFQFRKIETLLGLQHAARHTYNGKSYTEPFNEEQIAELQAIEKENSLIMLLEDWLERIPFIETSAFNFIEKYELAVEAMIRKEKEAITAATYISPEQKRIHLQMLDGISEYFESVFNEEAHNESIEKGKLKLSYRAIISALFINLYRDQPILQLPFKLLSTLIEIDESLSNWRYRHAQMVRRMIGQKIGTGGSSGYDYLKKTSEKHHIFLDLQKITTLLIPRSELFELPEALIRELGFYFSATKK
ncbi:MAG: tryptophan 2,3-dioxygenase family protein [Bacteroidota bacterium]